MVPDNELLAMHPERLAYTLLAEGGERYPHLAYLSRRTRSLASLELGGFASAAALCRAYRAYARHLFGLETVPWLPDPDVIRLHLDALVAAESDHPLFALGWSRFPARLAGRNAVGVIASGGSLIVTLDLSDGRVTVAVSDTFWTTTAEREPRVEEILRHVGLGGTSSQSDEHAGADADDADAPAAGIRLTIRDDQSGAEDRQTVMPPDGAELVHLHRRRIADDSVVLSGRHWGAYLDGTASFDQLLASSDWIGPSTVAGLGALASLLEDRWVAA